MPYRFWVGDASMTWSVAVLLPSDWVFPISVPLYTGGVLEKDPAPHLTARQEQAVQVISSNKAPFRRYLKYFLALVDMGLLDYIRTADTVTSSRGKTLVVPTSDVGGSSQPETSEESADSFYETVALNSEDAKRWYIPRWNINNDSLLDDGFSCRTLVDRVATPGFFSTLRKYGI
ncbi:hypothetical protein Tco_1264062 [Tanacetum coccineum]